MDGLDSDLRVTAFLYVDLAIRVGRLRCCAVRLGVECGTMWPKNFCWFVGCGFSIGARLTFAVGIPLVADNRCLRRSDNFAETGPLQESETLSLIYYVLGITSYR